ncbi:hypothetical protein [Methylobacterium sp. AMS5]|uniref:hypothetical protein n=1 Tax=Methylobacterium sp. AMS5 TaxID=925818 RepID=UPI00074F8DB8|nr:hypothetical protein [Methylobacterium sp. AMS5]AMB48313.1 hypothetical protein Y590_25430 [Methylobacterium sp. AMS5]
MSRSYYTPSLAVIAAEAATLAGDTIAKMVATEPDARKRHLLKEASDGLFAIGSGTDCLVTDADLFEDE